MPEVLITREDFGGIVQITSNTDFDNQVKPCIIKSQDMELTDWLGDGFVYDLLHPEPSSKYDDLLNGKEYLVGDIKTSFPGLKKVLVFLSAAKLVWTLDKQNTSGGIYRQRNEFADHVDDKTLARISNEHFNAAEAYWRRVEAYLNAEHALYPLWRTNACETSYHTKRRPRISAIGYSTNDNF